MGQAHRAIAPGASHRRRDLTAHFAERVFAQRSLGFKSIGRPFMTQIAAGIVIWIVMASAIYLFVEKFVDRH